MKNKKVLVFRVICGLYLLISLVSLVLWQHRFAELYVLLAAPSMVLAFAQACFEIGEPLLGFVLGGVECGIWLLLMAGAGAAAKGKRLGRNTVYGILGLLIVVNLFFIKLFNIVLMVGLMILLHGIWKDSRE